MTITLPSTSMRKSLEQASLRYEKALKDSDLGMIYLTKRGITSETAEYFRLGLVDDPAPGHEFNVGRLSIPYITQTGIVQIRFRALPYDGIPGNPEPSPKIKSEAGSGNTIYNVSALHSSNPDVFVCEGEPDTWSAHQAGLPVIGIPGANAWQEVYGRILRFRKVCVLADNDDHGEGLKFAETVQHSTRARIVLMPSGHDVNSFLMENGEEEFRKLVKYV